MESELGIVPVLDIKRKADTVTRKEIMLVKYDNVIRYTDYHVLQVLKKPEWKELFSHILDIDRINPTLEEFVNLPIDNILENYVLSRVEYTIEDLKRYRRGIINHYMDFYAKTTIAPFYRTIQRLLTSEHVLEKIYIIHDEFDVRIDSDIEALFDNNMKIEYVHGDYKEFLSNHTEITSLVTDNISNIGDCITTGNIKWLEIILIEYGYNKINNKFIIDLESIMKEYTCKIATIKPI